MVERARTQLGLRRPLLGPIWGMTSLAGLSLLLVAWYLGAADPSNVAWRGWLVLGVAVLSLVAAGMFAVRGVRRDLQRALIVDAYQTTSEAFIVSDPFGRIKHANEAAARLLKLDRLVDLSQIEALLAEDEAALARFQRMRRGVEGGTPFSSELRRRRADGHTVWWHISAKPMETWKGHVQWRFEDITVRREIELILREEQIKLVDFMDHAPVGFYSVDQDGTFVFANATLAEWLGVEPRDLVEGKRRLHDFLKSPPKAASPYDLVDNAGDRPTVEVPMIGANGRTILASVAQTVVHGDDGRSVWTRSVVRDLTAEREMSEKLRASEDRFRRFFEDAPIGVTLLNQDARISEWNQAFEDMVEVEDGQLRGRLIADFVTDQYRHEIVRRLSSVLGGTGSDVPIELRMRGRRELIVSLFAKRLDGAVGEPPGILLQFIDQTDQKNLEAQFAQSQKMQAVGQLAGGIAHDFNNLLTAMIGFCDLLLWRHKPGDPSFGDIMQVKQNANRAANLVRQLLAFSRQQTLQPRLLNLTDVLAELSHLLRRLIGENIEMKMTHGRDLGLVMVDQGQMEQVIINLAVNARDAMPSGGRVEIHTSNVTTTKVMHQGTDEMPPGNWVRVTISDTGIGIPPENLDRIFDPFFSTKEVGSGTGLGLSTVYGIVRQTGGYVFVDSTLGEGTAFSVYLPQSTRELTAETAAPQPVDERPRDLTGAGRILLVEDEDAVRVFGARALRNKGYEVSEAPSGPAALDLLNSLDRQIDLLITDVVMPQMDGPTLIRKVQEIRPDIKVICISGYTEDRLRDSLDGDSPVHFLAKPFTLKQLASKVKDVLRPAE